MTVTVRQKLHYVTVMLSCLQYYGSTWCDLLFIPSISVSTVVIPMTICYLQKLNVSTQVQATKGLQWLVVPFQASLAIDVQVDCLNPITFSSVYSTWNKGFQFCVNGCFSIE